MKKLLKIGLLLAFMLAMPAAALAAKNSFQDVAAGAWYAEAVGYMQEQGIMNGNTADEFGPDENMTRAMLATALYRMAGQPEFTSNVDFLDVEAEQWYSSAIAWAVENKLFSGYDDRYFGINDAVTREQLAAVLWRYIGGPASAVTKPYADYTSVSEYAAAAVNWSAEHGIMSSAGVGVFAPQAEATRAQAAEALMNCLLYQQNTANAETENKE